MSEAEDIAERNAPAFGRLFFSDSATRKHHLQASGFYWSDELPHEHGVTELEDDYYRLIVYLISYRAQLVRENESPEFVRYASVWTALKSKCANWPGFHESRCAPELADQLRVADEEAGRGLDRYFRLCERKRDQNHNE